MKHNAALPGFESTGATVQRQTNETARILMVEDDLCISQIFAKFLTCSGYEVVVANDGAEAWAVLNDESYDLMITDQDMPNLTGIELIGRLRAAHVEMPVIMAAGAFPVDDFARRPWLQPDATLLKPFAVGDLLRAVKKILGEEDNKEGNSIPQGEEPTGSLRQYPTKPAFRILVVDDDSDIRQLSVDVLAVSGYDVDAVMDGAAGWEALQAKSYDLVITDNKMPRLTGLEMIEKLRATRSTLPVIMATRCLPAHEFSLKPWLKPDAELQRPCSNDELLHAVRKILSATTASAGGSHHQ